MADTSKSPTSHQLARGCPQEPLDSLYGIDASHPTAELGRPASLVLFDDNNPPKIVPIGYTGMGGLIILDTAPGESRGAIFLKQAFGDFHYLADGIEAFFGLLREPTGG